MIALLFAQAAVQVAPPPVPPPVTISRSPYMPGPVRSRFRVAVSIRAADGVLWSGSLWVSSRTSASWRQAVQEAQADECAQQSAFSGNISSELSVQLNVQSSFDQVAGEQLAVNVRWSRPAAAPCGGNRAVELRQTIRLDQREPVILKGDGGLVVELRRG